MVINDTQGQNRRLEERHRLTEPLLRRDTSVKTRSKLWIYQFWVCVKNWFFKVYIFHFWSWNLLQISINMSIREKKSGAKHNWAQFWNFVCLLLSYFFWSADMNFITLTIFFRRSIVITLSVCVCVCLCVCLCVCVCVCLSVTSCYLIIVDLNIKMPPAKSVTLI